MKHTLAFLLIAFSFSLPIFAQNVGDTIYYDSNWKKINNRDKAYYFRSIDKKAGDLFYVTDHYSNGNPQMRGAYSFAEPAIKNGEFTFYNSRGQVTSIGNYTRDKLNGKYQEFDKDGKLSAERTYIDDKLEGESNYFEPDGKISVSLNYIHSKKNGKYQAFYPNGKLEFEVNYLDDKYEGKYLSYFATGQLRTDREYAKGKLTGLFLSYYPDGVKKREDHFKNDKLMEGRCFTHSGADTTYFPFMVSPEFIGGEAACGEYVRSNLKYPEAAKENNITGKVYISFHIDQTGDVVDATVTQGVDPLLDEAALAVVKTMPKWKPGIVDGQIESIEFSLPINFTLGDK